MKFIKRTRPCRKKQ